MVGSDGWTDGMWRSKVVVRATVVVCLVIHVLSGVAIGEWTYISAWIG